MHAKSICRLLQTTGLDCPLFAIVTEGGLAAVNAEWGVDDVILHTAGPAEVEARVRLAIGRRAAAAVAEAPDEIRSGELAIDEATYAARLTGQRPAEPLPPAIRVNHEFAGHLVLVPLSRRRIQVGITGDRAVRDGDEVPGP